jgi:hypothetical protein
VPYWDHAGDVIDSKLDFAIKGPSLSEDQKSFIHILVLQVLYRNPRRSCPDHRRDLDHIALPDCHRLDILDKQLLDLLGGRSPASSSTKRRGCIHIGKRSTLSLSY